MEKDYLYCRSSNNNIGFINFIESLGGDGAALLRKVYGRNIIKQEKRNLVPWSTIYQLYELAAKKCEEPNLGLKWALEMPNDFKFSGPSIFLLSITDNTKHFIDLAITFQKVHSNAVGYSYRVDEDKDECIGRVEFHPMAEYSRHFAEYSICLVSRFGFRFAPGFSV